MGSPLVNQFRKGGISRDVRLTAASGALPLTPSDQVELLFLLTRDSDADVSRKAEESLVALSDQDLVSVLKEVSISDKVLAFFGGRSRSEEVQQAILRNATTPDHVICAMVPLLSEGNLEFVVVNQMRLLRHTPIIAALEANENLNSDQGRRIRELKHDFKLDRPAEEPRPEPPPPEPVGKLDLGTGPAEEQEPPPKSREEAEALYGLSDPADGELSEEEAEKKKSIFQRIVTMTASEKMMEALKGEREARMMLVRDRNRAVWSAVLASPSMNEADAEHIAQMRNVAPDVLREVGKNRQWTKRYKVAHELVKNPKTPPEVSSQLLARLSERDRKSLIRDRNVPETIRRQAQKMTRASK